MRILAQTTVRSPPPDAVQTSIAPASRTNGESTTFHCPAAPSLLLVPIPEQHQELLRVTEEHRAARRQRRRSSGTSRTSLRCTPSRCWWSIRRAEDGRSCSMACRRVEAKHRPLPGSSEDSTWAADQGASARAPEVRAASQSSPSSASSMTRIRARPVRIRVFTVPSGSAKDSATCR